MIGREAELAHLVSLYENPSFEFLVMYGRRRVGKTTLLQEFAKSRNAIFYPAQEKNDSLNLADFSKMVQLHFDGTSLAPFTSWKDAFTYIGMRASERVAIIIDEFPYIAEENPTVKSILQHVIDHSWKDNPNIMLVLCGSSISFMESDVMGAKSPLHDRQTSSLEVLPFDYLDSARFFPGYSNEQKLIAYGILGGVPRYLEAFDSRRPIQENIAERIVRSGAYLREEPMNLLRAEFRNPNIYNSILSAIAGGHNRPAEIADYIHEEKTKVSKYLVSLQSLRLIDKRVPCGEAMSSRKGIYTLRDNFFTFWFRYLFDNGAYYSMLGPDAAAQQIVADLPNLMGNAFEGICMEYLVRRARAGLLPFVPYQMGRWWGTNPAIKAQDDVDILLLDKGKRQAIFVECKFTSSPMPHEEYEDLETAMLAFPDIPEKRMMFISKSGFKDSVVRHAEEDGTVLLTLDDLFEV